MEPVLGKRKSSCEGEENVAPETDNSRKTRSQIAKRTSALPRYLPKKAGEDIKIEEKKVLQPAHPVPVATENDYKSPIRAAGSTLSNILKAVLGTGSKPVPPKSSPVPETWKDAKTPPPKGLSQKYIIPDVPAPRIQNMFDQNISISDEKLHEIIHSLKLKSKFDAKEKATKQAAAIAEFRSLIKTTIDEVKQLKTKCIEVETQGIGIIQRAREDLLQTVQVVNDASYVEKKMSKELDTIRIEKDELQKHLFSGTENTTKKVVGLEGENTTLKFRVQELEAQLEKLEEKLKFEESSKMQLDIEAKALRSELSGAKQEIVEAQASAHSKYEQKVEKTITEYKEEILLVKMEISKKQCEIDRLIFDKSEADKKFADTRESQLKSETMIRDITINMDRCQAEITRLNTDLAAARAQVLQKDEDIRSTMKSIADIQKDGFDEKNKLRQEVSSLQSRIMLLEEERLSLTSQLAAKTQEALSASRELISIKDLAATLQQKLASQEQEIATAKDAMVQLEVERELRMRSEVREDTERRERNAAVGQLFAIQNECTNRVKEIKEEMIQETGKLKEEVTQLALERDKTVLEAKSHVENITGLVSEIQSLKSSLAKASENAEQMEQLSKMNGELEIMRRRFKEATELKVVDEHAYSAKIKELEEQVRHGESQRRLLHNKIQELRGNVRVFARVRPYLPSDGVDLSNVAAPEATINVKSDGCSLKIKHTSTATVDEQHKSAKDEECGFSFDKVFGPSVGQEDVFKEVSEFVQSALDGYNVCLFSYGQTGSGKTHTMQGSGCENMRGIIPRAIEQVGKYKTELESKGWTYTMEVTFVEIYNETIRDLLRNTVNDDMKHEIKKDVNGCTTITDIMQMNIDPNNESEVEKVMELAARHRSIGKTDMNEQSSRSHSVFTLHLQATNPLQGMSLKGTLSLVDLAGSERLDRSGATGMRMKESIQINKSLSALADVFTAIANKQSHVPFRNSKLTYLLQSALSGDGKTLMLVNLSPTEESYYESYCSLKFAAQVNQCELGKPKRQIKDAPAAAVPSSTGLALQSTESSSTGPNSTSALATAKSVKARPASALTQTPTKTSKIARMK